MNDAVHHIGTYFCAIAAIMIIHSCRTANQLQEKKTTLNEPYDSVVVDRDSNMYTVKKLRNNMLWMTTNLKLTIPGSSYYNDSAKYGERYGRLYTWEAAQAGCALLGEDWRLPTKEDWQELGKSYGTIGREETNIAKRAYYPLLTGGNSQFNAVLGGGRNPDGSYARLEAHGFYWTGSINDHHTAWFANFAKGSQALYLRAEGEKRSAFSVRCVKSKNGLKQ